MSSGGTVRQRPNGLWEGRFWHDGRRRSVYGKTKRETQDKLRQAMLNADGGVKVQSGKLTVSDHLDNWLASHVENELRARTAESYRLTTRLYLKPHLGRIPLTKLTPEHVQGMLTKINDGTRSTTTVAYVRIVLRAALAHAVQQRLVTENVAKFAKPPKRERKIPTPLTLEQIDTFLDSVASDRRRALYLAAVQLGLRQGELLALRWQDVDLDNAVINVRHSLLRVDGVVILAEPKTEKSVRSLDISHELVATLRDHRVRQLQERLAAGRRWKDGDFVFTSTIGTPLDGINVTHAFQVALKTAGLPHQRFHDLRHACATVQLENGEELAVVSKYLGHANLNTTADVYAHLTRGMGRRVADRWDSLSSQRRQAAGS